MFLVNLLRYTFLPSYTAPLAYMLIVLQVGLQLLLLLLTLLMLLLLTFLVFLLTLLLLLFFANVIVGVVVFTAYIVVGVVVFTAYIVVGVYSSLFFHPFFPLSFFPSFFLLPTYPYLIHFLFHLFRSSIFYFRFSSSYPSPL